MKLSKGEDDGRSMLRKVCFILQEETRNRLADMVKPLLRELAGHSVQVEGIRQPWMEAKPAGDEESLICLAEMVPCVGKKEEILYITDVTVYYEILKKRGCYVLPYLHRGNRSASFPGAAYAIEQLEEMDHEALDMAYRRLAGLPWQILTTERCLVRETTVEDVEVFYRIYQEKSVTEYMEDLFEDPEEEIAYTKDYIEKVYGFYGYGMWTVVDRESGQIIGRAGITWREGFDLPELGFVIGVPWQRQGYAYEVCSAILAYAGEELGMTRVQALVMEGNDKSAALCEKLEFAQEAGRVELEGENYMVWVKNMEEIQSIP